RVLASMRRLYTRQQYLEKVAMLRQAVPDIGLSTDLIVGFPGESEEDFQETLSLLCQVRYDSIFAFKYSVRPLTPATTYPDQVSGEAKTERIHGVLQLGRDRAGEESRAGGQDRGGLD